MNNSDQSERSFDEDQCEPIILTPLFSQQQGDGTIKLLARDEQRTSLIHINDIQYYFYIGIIPTWSEQQFQRFLMKYVEGCRISVHSFIDSESFTFRTPWKFFKVQSNKCDVIKNILKESPLYTIYYNKNNYFLQNFKGKQLESSFNCGRLHFDYYQELMKLDYDSLKGYDRFAYMNLRFPFRQQAQTTQAIQIKYKLNFQDTLVFKRYDIKQIRNSNFKYDQVITVSINDIKQNPTSLINQHLQHYRMCMFDIENVVIKKEQATYNKWIQARKNMKSMDPIFSSIADVLQMSKNVQIKSDTYVGKIGLDHIDSNQPTIEIIQQNIQQLSFDDKCCDQNEIICISFIIADFNGQIIKKIALVRSEYEPSEQYADEVIQTSSEYDLLKQMIRILGNKDYNLIVHFNGWGFDEKMISIRLIMHGLFEEYLSSMNMENEFNPRDFTYDGRLKLPNTFNLFQIINNLRFSFDIFFINKLINPDADKIDGGSLDTLLKYYGLESKEGISYQQLTDFFLEYKHQVEIDDSPDNQELQEAKKNMKLGYNYCQWDSIQSVKLQNHLGLLQQMIQMSLLTRVPLKQCVYNAVTAKVDSVVMDAYNKNEILLIESYNPFSSPFHPDDKDVKKMEQEKDHPDENEPNKPDGNKPDGNKPDENKLDELNELNELSESNDSDSDQEEKENKNRYGVNIGGDVQCNIPGGHESITAIDAKASYPAQKEANNIDKCCIVIAEDMERILFNPEEYGVKIVGFKKLYDMYSPYLYEELGTDFLEFKVPKFEEKYDLSFYRQRQIKTYRWQIDLEKDGVIYQMQQFFFQKQHQQVKYSFCFIVQGKGFSPKAQMLTGYRMLRYDTQKQQQQALTQALKIFLQSKQMSIKTLCNSEYGQTDSVYEPMTFNLFESSLVTKCGRYIILNARDILESRQLIRCDCDPKPRNVFNQFCERVYENPELITVQTVQIDEQEIIDKLHSLGLTDEEIEIELRRI